VSVGSFGERDRAQAREAQVIDPVWSSRAPEPDAHESIDVGLRPEHVQFLIDPVRHLRFKDT